MYGFIQTHQLDIMLALCAICAIMGIMLFITKFLSKRRKWILIFMELLATLLLAFDRAAYIYKGDVSDVGYVMVRLSNFMVFFLTSAIVLGFDLYLMDLLLTEGKQKHVPLPLKIVLGGSVFGMLMAVVSHFTGLYYTFDENNIYQRGPGFLLCYLVPVLCPLMQYYVIRKYKKCFSRLIYISLVLYIFVPIVMGIIQIFTYGLSIVNMAMVLVSVFLYFFNFLDINAEVIRAHEIEVDVLHKEKLSMKRLFDQTVTAIVTAADKRDIFTEGHSVRVAELARNIAKEAGKNDEKCDEVYYAALLHDVGTIGIPESITCKDGSLTGDEYRLLKKKPVFGAEILSSITEYPYLSEGVRHSREWYDGSGYPDGLKGKDIPEISRIITVADAYDTMMSGKRTRSPMTYQTVREEFIKMAGVQFDPEFAEIIINLMDRENSEKYDDEVYRIETEVRCGRYRDKVSVGIPVSEEVTRISFDLEKTKTAEGAFSAPSIVLFDSYDRRIHNENKTVEAYRYVEFGELWFDGHYVSTNARNTEVRVTENQTQAKGYEITAGRFEDHLSVRLVSPDKTVDVIMALPDNSKSSYIGLTGENCFISNIKAAKTGEVTADGDIRKIVSKLTYTDRLESDLPNLQIDHTRSAATDGILIENELELDFHTLSLPSADLVWHCPYIVLFYSDDKKVFGEGYVEYTMIKLNGESSGSSHAENDFRMKKTEEFPGWDDWKLKNKEGMECSVRFVRKGSKVTIHTENLGILIENTTVVSDGGKTIYAAISGDQVAITDIRVIPS